MARRPKVVSQAFADVGPVRYSVERFLSSCEPGTAKALRKAWQQGAQLASARVPTDALPAVVILAAWADRIGIALVDDYDALLDRMRQAFDDRAIVHHPDLFFASSICILAMREQTPTIGAFESIGVNDIYNQLMGE